MLWMSIHFLFIEHFPARLLVLVLHFMRYSVTQNICPSNKKSIKKFQYHHSKMIWDGKVPNKTINKGSNILGHIWSVLIGYHSSITRFDIVLHWSSSLSSLISSVNSWHWPLIKISGVWWLYGLLVRWIKLKWPSSFRDKLILCRE